MCGSFLNPALADEIYGKQTPDNLLNPSLAERDFYREYAITGAVYESGGVNVAVSVGHNISWQGDNAVYGTGEPYSGFPRSNLPPTPGMQPTLYYSPWTFPALSSDNSVAQQLYHFHTHPNDPNTNGVPFSSSDASQLSNHQPAHSAQTYPVFGGVFDGENNKFHGKVNGHEYSIGFSELRSALGCN